MMDHTIDGRDSNFDVKLANRLARLESYNKHLYRPNSYLHKWWARRCGSTFRLILKSLVEESAKRDYYAAGGLEGKVVLDPMLGGGTTLHEAIRMGANVIGFDVDPIPVLQAMATLSPVQLADIQEAFSFLLSQLEKELVPFYMTHCSECGRDHPVRYYLYGLRRHCDCGEALFVDSFVLRREPDGNVVRLCDRCHRVVEGNQDCDCPAEEGQRPLYEKKVKVCPSCAGRFKDDLSELFYRRYQPLVAAVDCDEQKTVFRSVTAADTSILRRANELRGQLAFSGPTTVEPGPKSDDLIRRGIHDYQDLYSSRQLLYLRQAIDCLQHFEPQIRLYLSLLVSTSLEFNVMLCGYKGSGVRRAGAVRHAFSHHAYSFPYTAVENNPVADGRASGTLRRLFSDRVRRARKWARQPMERSIDGSGAKFVAIEGELDLGVSAKDFSEFGAAKRRQFMVRQGSAADTGLPADSVDYIVTDPPYYDSVQYGNLSSFFRVWLRQMLDQESAREIRWEYPRSDSAAVSVQNDMASAAYEHYLESMSAIFEECQRVLKDEQGRLIFSFHHWKAVGWSAITVALKRAGFRLLQRHVVHSENPMSVHIANLNSLTDDAILVLGRRSADIAAEWPRPGQIRTGSSADFSLDCADALGWMLGAEISESAIAAWWTRQLGDEATVSKPPAT